MGHFMTLSKHLHLLAGSVPVPGTPSLLKHDWPDWEFCWDVNFGKKGGGENRDQDEAKQQYPSTNPSQGGSSAQVVGG